MSLTDLCTGSIASVQLAANTMGAMGDNDPAYADTGTTVEFGLQSATVQESLRYSARGEEKIYNAFFSSDPSLTPQNRLKVTQWMGVTQSPAKFLRVLNSDTEGPPGEAWLWIVVCREDTLERR